MSMLLRPRDLGMGQTEQQEAAALDAKAAEYEAQAATVGNATTAASLRAQAAQFRAQANALRPQILAPTVIRSSGIGIGHVLLGLGGLAALGGIVWAVRR